MTFRCSRCGAEFESAWSDKEAHAEAKALFGEDPKPTDAVLCNGCYEKFLAWLESPEGRAFDARVRAERKAAGLRGVLG